MRLLVICTALLTVMLPAAPAAAHEVRPAYLEITQSAAASYRIVWKQLLLRETGVCVIGIEAWGSAHFWGRKLSELGHTVKLMAPQFDRERARRFPRRSGCEEIAARAHPQDRCSNLRRDRHGRFAQQG
jgi:transposase